MRTLSATALAPDEGVGPSTASPPAVGQVAATSMSSIPTFTGYDRQVYAIESRRAGRINAASVSDEEIEALLRERQRLLDKKFDETLSRRESNRLEYVRWSLARVEDARTGEALDALENFAEQYKQFHDDVVALADQITQQSPASRR